MAATKPLCVNSDNVPWRTIAATAPPQWMAVHTESTARVTPAPWLAEPTRSNARTTTTITSMKLSFKSTRPDPPWLLLKGLFWKGIIFTITTIIIWATRKKGTSLGNGCSFSSAGCVFLWVFSRFVPLPGGSDLQYTVHVNPFRFQLYRALILLWCDEVDDACGLNICWEENLSLKIFCVMLFVDDRFCAPNCRNRGQSLIKGRS